MGRHSEIMKPKLRKGLWSPEEDEKLFNYISRFGVGSWSTVSKLAGLERCGKSCRLRWMNYLRPHLKRGMFSQQEEDLIISLHQALGNRWAQIAAKLSGRTDNEIKNFWNSYLKKKLMKQGIDPNTHKPISEKDDRKGKIFTEKSPLVLPWTKVNHVEVSPNWSSIERVFELRKTQVVPTISSEMEQEFHGANANYYYEVGGGREASSEKFGSKPIFDTQFPYEFQESFEPNGYNSDIVPHYSQNNLNRNSNFEYASDLTLSDFSDNSNSRISSFSFNEVKESSRNSSNLSILENDGTFSCGDGKFEEKLSLWPEGQIGNNPEAFSSFQLMALSENMDFSSKYYL